MTQFLNEILRHRTAFKFFESDTKKDRSLKLDQLAREYQNRITSLEEQVQALQDRILELDNSTDR